MNNIANLRGLHDAVTVGDGVDIIGASMSGRCGGSVLSFDETLDADAATARNARRPMYSENIACVIGVTAGPTKAAASRHDRPDVDRMCSPTTDRKRVTSP